MSLQLNFIPPPITDPAKPLTEAVAPSGWEHLGGSLRWYETDGEPYLDPRHGPAIRIRYTDSPISALVARLAETKRETGECTPPFRIYLFHGAAGIGKTLLMQLLAETFLYKDHTPVGVQFGDVHYKFVDPQGETLEINPSCLRPSRVERALFTEMLTDRAVQVYNAGSSKTGKGELSDMIANMKSGSFPGQRRVFIIGEIDNITAQQTPPLKTGLDPHHGIPGHVLFMADTNKLGKVRHAMQETIKRFEVIMINDWPLVDLAALTYHYATQLEIPFDLSTFASPEHPFYRIAETSEGSVREVLKTLEALRGVKGAVTATNLEQFVNRASTFIIEIPIGVDQFLGLPDYQLQRVVHFCREQAHWNRSLPSFVIGLTNRVADDYPEVLAAYAQVMKDIDAACVKPEGMTIVGWIQIAPILSYIGSIIRQTLQARYMAAQQGQPLVPPRGHA